MSKTGNTQHLFADEPLARVLPDWRGSNLQPRLSGTRPLLLQLLQSALVLQCNDTPAYRPMHAAQQTDLVSTQNEPRTASDFFLNQSEAQAKTASQLAS